MACYKTPPKLDKSVINWSFWMACCKKTEFVVFHNCQKYIDEIDIFMISDIIIEWMKEYNTWALKINEFRDRCSQSSTQKYPMKYLNYFV